MTTLRAGILLACFCLNFLLTSTPTQGQDFSQSWSNGQSFGEAKVAGSHLAGSGNFCVLLRQTADLERFQGPVPKSVPAGRMIQLGRENWLRGGVNWSDTDSKISEHFDELLDTARARDAQTAKLDNAVAHFRKPSQKAIAQSKDAVNYLIPYRGFGPSSEAADIVLDEKLKLKSKAAADYARQHQVDQLHWQLAKATMQIAMGLGDRDRTHGDTVVSTGVTKLSELVGSEEATKTLRLLSSWASKLDVPPSAFTQPSWDVAEQDSKTRMIISGALEKDPVAQGIKTVLHKYNHMSKAKRAAGHVIETALGAAALAPNFIGSAAQLGLMFFEMATGGPEDAKLLKELYLNKRFDSRFNTINEETHLALNNYQLAVLTHNPVLLAYSQYWVQQLAGDKPMSEVFSGQEPIAETSPRSEPATGPQLAPIKFLDTIE